MVAAKNIKNAAEQMNSCKKGVDKLVDLYEVTEKLKRFNEILNEVGGSL